MAEEALSMGLVNRVLPGPELLDRSVRGRCTAITTKQLRPARRAC
jgi:hypothetical protein